MDLLYIQRTVPPPSPPPTRNRSGAKRAKLYDICDFVMRDAAACLECECMITSLLASRQACGLASPFQDGPDNFCSHFQSIAVAKTGVQVEEAKRRWQWGQKARTKRRSELQAELLAMDDEDMAAEALVQSALAALQEVKRQQTDQTGTH